MKGLAELVSDFNVVIAGCSKKDRRLLSLFIDKLTNDNNISEVVKIDFLTQLVKCKNPDKIFDECVNACYRFQSVGICSKFSSACNELFHHRGYDALFDRLNNFLGPDRGKVALRKIKNIFSGKLGKLEQRKEVKSLLMMAGLRGRDSLRELKVSDYIAWLFDGGEEDSGALQDLNNVRMVSCRLGLKNESNEGFIFKVNFPTVIALKQPTVFDANVDYVDFYEPGGKTIPNSACAREKEFEEWISSSPRFVDVFES